ncbi:ribosomal large subunit pseudouridine synthase D [Ligilactobacillus salitolerans]|uniref:Pseudouridine synthase n=1 Tax=Ligilactobacillus salitolerans TaxID=1808352 RepID=A0A401IW85_9LACO|nr:RluA family pseudouridine synthase [Ligilactobacillus salitolerans]GBG95813.1 ribosomal large subunit pseudouridine synthase D [Ligilactobacillus salitolerans]
MREFTITDESGRLDQVLAAKYPEFSRSLIKKMLTSSNILVNDEVKKPRYMVKNGDRISLTEPEPEKIELVAQDIPLTIVYEDDDVLVVNKPAGMVVHPAPGHPDHTLVNALLYHSPLSQINGTLRPGIVHRIDRDTSGLLMVAKNDQAHRSLSKQLKDKTTTREYIALVHGVIKEAQGTIDAPLDRSPKDRKKQAVVAGGRRAVTHFTVLQRFTAYTLVKCRLETGRTHQIRVHMKYIGHPVAGDPVYGPKKTLAGPGQFLHAAKLGFTHPVTGQRLNFQADLPDYFKQVLDQLDKSADNE